MPAGCAALSPSPLGSDAAMKRNTKLVLGLTALGLAFGGMAAAAGTGAVGAPPVVLDRTHDADGVLSVVWTGDVLLGDAAEPLLAEHGPDWPLANVASLLDADVVVVNHEAPITTLTEPFVPSNPYSYAADPATASALASAGVDVLSLANNHVMDMGPKGFADTTAAAEGAGMLVIGAGTRERQAERPLIITGDGVTVGVVSLGKGYGYSVTASRKREGTLPYSSASIKRGYALAKRAGADYVVGFVHWGKNYQPAVLDEQRRVARLFAEAGYDLVIGHGPHVVQRAEVVDGTPVFYSLGNFVFGTTGRWKADARGYGFVLQTDFTADGVKDLRVTCIETDNEQVHFQPRPCDAETAARLLQAYDITRVVEHVVR